MEYKEILDSARTCIGPYCKACPVCNGKACGNQVPGPGAKAPGNGFIRNFDAWQKICVNMDPICPTEPGDTAVASATTRSSASGSLKSSIWPEPAAAKPSPWTLTARVSPS